LFPPFLCIFRLGFGTIVKRGPLPPPFQPPAPNGDSFQVAPDPSQLRSESDDEDDLEIIPYHKWTAFTQFLARRQQNLQQALADPERNELHIAREEACAQMEVQAKRERDEAIARTLAHAAAEEEERRMKLREDAARNFGEDKKRREEDKRAAAAKAARIAARKEEEAATTAAARSAGTPAEADPAAKKQKKELGNGSSSTSTPGSGQMKPALNVFGETRGAFTDPEAAGSADGGSGSSAAANKAVPAAAPKALSRFAPEARPKMKQLSLLEMRRTGAKGAGGTESPASSSDSEAVVAQQQAQQAQQQPARAVDIIDLVD
jgi:hypothetical protein